MNPVMLDLGFFEIRWYSFFIVLAIAISTFFIVKEAKRFNIEKEFIINVVFWVIIMGIIGARLYFVLFNWDYYGVHKSEIFKVWNGGLAVHGGIIFGLLTIIVFGLKYKANILRLLDIFAPWVLFSQALGRWGNFFNGEAYGQPTTLEHLQSLPIPDFIVNGMLINGTYYTPTFLYESLWCFAGFILLMVVKRLKHTRIGMLTAIYLMWYAVGRFVIEISRTDSLMLGSIKVAQLVSVTMFIFGLIIFFIKLNKRGLENMYNDTEEKENLRY